MVFASFHSPVILEHADASAALNMDPMAARELFLAQGWLSAPELRRTGGGGLRRRCKLLALLLGLRVTDELLLIAGCAGANKFVAGLAQISP